jgi:hypothetical protein
MLTGKHPTDDMFKDGLNLHKFVETSLIPDYDVEEPSQGSNNNVNQASFGMEVCTLQLAKIGLKCSANSPKDRPAIKDVYSEVVAVKEAFSSLCD